MFKDKIRFYRKLRGISQEALADKLGYKSFTTIQKWEDGTSSPPIGTVKKVADILGVTIEELTSDDNHSVDPDLTGISNISFPASRPIPILGDICAGEGTWCEENFEGHFFIDSSVKADFCVRVRGDSMIDAGIFNGDLAFIKKTYDYTNGKIYAVRINSDCEAVLKKVFWQEDTIILNPCNADYEPIVTDAEGMTVIGECVGVFHSTISMF
ncbi:MAG: helix-turn-helix domain-containing protein [[Eubacterium] sulci]|jgi:repressor LexA|nr:helix-turn-helix domain-containing protein [[Eubacterium] sulci]MBF1181396.1 helix-turn-helix domain-containing protein [[Eubacterium] sulci]